MPQEQPHSHEASMSTGRIDNQDGILSDATTRSETPHWESPTETEEHASINEEIKVTHTPHTTRCGVVPQPAGSIPLHTNIQEVQQKLRSGTAAAVPAPQADTTGTATAEAGATEKPASGTRDQTSTAEIIFQAKEAWRRAYKAMMNMEPPGVVKAAADAAIEMTAKYWSFKATESVEAVIMKCTQRMPLTFANPALGTVLRILNPEATAVMWAQTKRQRKAATGSSSYVTEVTGTFSSMDQARAAWHDHYHQRKQTNDRHCYNRTTQETVAATGSEMEELFIELDATLHQGFSESASAVSDEAGDVWYGTQCYTSAYIDQAHRAVSQWKAHATQAQPSTMSAQTDPDLTTWQVTSPSPEESLSRTAIQVEQVVGMAKSDADSGQIMATVRIMAEDLATTVGLTAGTVMQMAALTQAQLHTQTTDSESDHSMSTRTARTAMIENIKMVSASELLQAAEASGHSWEQARDTLISVLEAQTAAGCPNWERERRNTAAMVVKAAKSLQQEVHGKGMATRSPCMVIHQERVVMAASRLTRRAVQHYHATIRDAPTVAVPTHTHFAAVSSVHKDETGTTEEAEWFECSVGDSIEANQAPQTADGEAVAWHDCTQQKWSHRQQQDHTRHPHLTTSGIRRWKREQAEQHAVKDAIAVAAALDAEIAHQSKPSAQVSSQSSDEASRSEDSSADSSDESSSDESSEGETNKDSHDPATAVAGVSRDRREAKKRRLKPINTMIDLIKEARKPNRQHKATAARMLTRLVETNRTMQTVRQRMMQVRAKRRRARRSQLKQESFTDKLCVLRQWQLNK